MNLNISQYTCFFKAVLVACFLGLSMGWSVGLILDPCSLCAEVPLGRIDHVDKLCLLFFEPTLLLI